MSVLSAWYLNHIHRANDPEWASRFTFLLKRIFALVVIAIVLALTSVTLWLAFTRSVYLVLAFCAILFVGIFLPYALATPLLYPRRVQPTLIPDALGLTRWETVRFFSPDGVELKGWFIPPDPQSNGATLVLVHGLGANRTQLLGQAAMMIARGYGALLFDLRNHGTSGGTVTTLGYTEAEDVIGAVNYLLTRVEIKPARIGLVGYSMGGAAVLHAATRLPNVKAIVVESTYTSLEDNITQGMIAKTGLPPFPFAPIMIWFGEHITGLRIHQIRPIDDVAHLKQPILFIHGEQDKIVNVSNSQRLYAAANNPQGLYIVKNAGHAELQRADPLGFERYVLTFLERTLRAETLAPLPMALALRQTSTTQ